MERYARQIALPEIGERGQRRLLAGSALIVGLGGLGCPVGLYLAGAGVGRIGLCDPDVVSLHNLQRQTLYSEAEVGLPKAECARQRLSALNSEPEYDAWPCGVTEEIMSRYDVIIDCCDNFATRYLIDDVCCRLGKPWVHSTIGAFSGQVTTFMPGAATRYSDLYPDREELAAMPHASGGVLGAVPGVVGAIAAAESVKLLAGSTDLLDGRLLSVNLKTMQFNTLDL